MSALNPRIIALPILVAAAGGVFGYFMAENGPNLVPPERVKTVATLAWVAAGIFLFLSLLLLWEKQRQLLLVVLSVLAMTFISNLLGGPANGIFVVLLCAALLISYTRNQRELFGGNHGAALRHNLNMWLARNNGIVVVDNGKIIIPTTEGPHLGPRQIIVRPGNMVVMTSGTAISRVCGPSSFKSRKWEFTRQVLALGDRRKAMTFSNALTFDQLLVDVSITFMYGISVSDATRRGNNSGIRLKEDGSTGLTRNERSRILRLVTLAPEWERDIVTIVEGTLRNEVSHYEYDELLTFTNYLQLASVVQAIAHRRVERIGCTLTAVRVVNIAPRSEVVEAITDGERHRTRQLAEGQGFRDAISEVAAGYRTALRLGMNLDDIHREATRHMMEHMAEDPATKLVLTTPHNLNVDA